MGRGSLVPGQAARVGAAAALRLSSPAKDPDWPFHSSRRDSVDEVLSLYSHACARSRATAGRFDSLDAVAAAPSYGKGPANLRWILVHMIDETARHACHLDLLRDAIDRGASS
jgi:hypothetical protein